MTNTTTLESLGASKEDTNPTVPKETKFKQDLENEGLSNFTVVDNAQDILKKTLYRGKWLYGFSIALCIIILGLSVWGTAVLYNAEPVYNKSKTYNYIDNEAYASWRVASITGMIVPVIILVMLCFYWREYKKLTGYIGDGPNVIEGTINLTGSMSDLYNRHSTGQLLNSSMGKLLSKTGKNNESHSRLITGFLNDRFKPSDIYNNMKNN